MFKIAEAIQNPALMARNQQYFHSVEHTTSSTTRIPSSRSSMSREQKLVSAVQLHRLEGRTSCKDSRDITFLQYYAS